MGANRTKPDRMEVRRSIGNRAPPKPPTPSSKVAYLVAHACFECRKSFKRRLRPEGTDPTCPSCRRPLRCMGRSFKAPAMNNLEQWQKVALLYAHGFRFWSYGRPPAPKLPARLRDVEAFVRENPNHPCRVREA